MDPTPSGSVNIRGIVGNLFPSLLFVLSAGLLVIEVAQIRSVDSANRGLFALGSFLVIVLAAPLIYHERSGLTRNLVAPLAVVSGVLFVAFLPGLLAGSSSPRPDGSSTIQALAIVSLAWLLAKMLLLQRFSAIHCARVSLPEDEIERLLPFQEKDLEQLRKAILAEGVDRGSRVIQLIGRWGQGKSFVIERLGIFLQSRVHTEVTGKGAADECAVVVINVWEQQSEPDLHLAIVEQILSHDRYWYPYGWLHYPLSLFVARVTKEWRLALSAGAATKAKAEIQVPFTLPKPTGRRYLEQQVARVRKRGIRTVVVLDEIDRAAPRVVQSAMTLSRRSLDMPGIVVILSYVDQLIRHKAFNPLVRSLPDLDSTMHAVIFDQGPENAIGGVNAAPGGPLTAMDSASLRKWKAWEDAAEMRLLSSAGSSADDGEGKPDVKDSDDSRLTEALRLAYANAGVRQRRYLQELFSEKYLGTHPIQLRRLGRDDVASVVVHFDSLRNLVFELIGCAEPDKDTERDLVQTISSALETFESANPARREPPTLRKLEGELFLRLSSIDSRDRQDGSFSYQFIAAVVLVAYDVAARVDSSAWRAS